MGNQEPIPLTTSELGYLWTGYSINEMSKWYLTIFMEQSKDEDIQNIFAIALQNTTEMLIGREKLLSKEGYPIPLGFSETDIDKTSPSLFSERFLLFYLHVGTKLGLEFHTRALALAARADVRQYYIDCANATVQLHEQIVNLLLNKGLYSRTPTLPAPPSPETIQKTSYLNGWFGDSRPMNSMELANHYLLIELLVMMETLFIGFAQTTGSEEISELFKKGIKVVKSQYKDLAEMLKKDELPIPPCYTAEVTDSGKRIFSDRIMVCHMAGLFGSLLSEYGFSLGSVMKHDLLAIYTTQISKAGAFSEKIVKLLIEKEWVEKVPGA
jgi:hypothetical protein